MIIFNTYYSKLNIIAQKNWERKEAKIQEIHPLSYSSWNVLEIWTMV